MFLAGSFSYYATLFWVIDEKCSDDMRPTAQRPDSASSCSHIMSSASLSLTNASGLYVKIIKH